MLASARLRSIDRMIDSTVEELTNFDKLYRPNIAMVHVEGPIFM